MTELILNAFWVALAVVAFAAVPRRSHRVMLALGCALALLFPIISVSDDFAGDSNDFRDDAVALLVTAVVVTASLVAIAGIELHHPRPALQFVRTLSDPR